MSIDAFRATPLPEIIINALIEAASAYARTDALLGESHSIKPLLFDMLLCQDIYYTNYEAQLNIADICIRLHIPNQDDVVSKKAAVVCSCIEYAQIREQTVGILTAEDILRIDRTLRNSNSKYLARDEYHEPTEAIWSILHDLYGPKHQYHLILESAIAAYRLLTLSDGHHLNLQVLAILLSLVHRNPLAFRGLPGQWILSTDPRRDIASMDIEYALVHMLSLFQQMWEYKGTLVSRLIRKNEEFAKLIKQDYPQQAVVGFDKLLSENLCIRNRVVSEKLCISPKTTIKHLKYLEENNILYSVKRGREIFYFNIALLDLLEQMIEVPDNGEEKPQTFD